MSIFQPSALLQGIFSHDANSEVIDLNDQHEHGLFKPKSSLANLIHFVRNPLENLGENWQDGFTKEERARKQVVEDKTQLQYLRLRTVR